METVAIALSIESIDAREAVASAPSTVDESMPRFASVTPPNERVILSAALLLMPTWKSKSVAAPAIRSLPLNFVESARRLISPRSAVNSVLR